MTNPEKISIYGLKIDVINYSILSERIIGAISSNSKLIITYANANTINRIFRNEALKKAVQSFDIIHPDGVGIFIASKLLFGKGGLRSRFTGSDYYPILISELIRNNFSISFYGDTRETLMEIQKQHTDLNIRSMVQYVPDTPGEMYESLMNSSADVLLVGHGFPRQEEWILNNQGKLNYKVIIAVGDGMKVFAGTKLRGPKIFSVLGLEWFIRFLSNPVKYFKRYIIGNPLFLYRIIMLKMRNLRV
ncbi:MAG: WecB/TagA/CpsF family glycosyltransferase [Ignavibacteria bacterium]|nr:WecB/TagA/CpsF family glycosyltransferase [Ignavibacteria bacterium]